MKTTLIAPCGMNCRLCYGFIRPRKPCGGCNAPVGSKPPSCARCKIVVCEKRARSGWPTCAECDTPCQRLKDLDKRYRGKYHMSMLENLATIREHGMDFFLQRQNAGFRCPACGDILCVHRDACPSCKEPVW